LSDARSSNVVLLVVLNRLAKLTPAISSLDMIGTSERSNMIDMGLRP
jgi:hypothetical protein